MVICNNDEINKFSCLRNKKHLVIIITVSGTVFAEILIQKKTDKPHSNNLSIHDFEKIYSSS